MFKNLSSDRVAVSPLRGMDMALGIAARVIEKADGRTPADAVLKRELALAGHYSPSTRTEASQAVFSYYRWQGWLEADRPIEVRLRRALHFAKSFAEKPESFSTESLVQRALPAWAMPEIDGEMEWVRSVQKEPRLWLRAKKGTGKLLGEKLGNCWIPPQRELEDAIDYQGGEDLFRTPEFHSGEFELQDINSQVVGLCCDPQPGETWWDACAGEGGKMLHLSDLMQNKGLIWASDRAGWRLEKLKRRAARARAFNYRSVLWNGGESRPTKTRFDGLLVDAPCSGAGTWQRNPHARWTTTIEDVRELGGIQRQLLAHAAPAVKPGGSLIYAVCSMTRTETREVAEFFEKQFPEFEPRPFPNPFQPSVPRHLLQLWPQDTGGNGMFVASWRRKS